MRSRIGRIAIATVVAAVVSVAAGKPIRAVGPTAPETFADVVHRSALVVLVTIHPTLGGGVVLDVERVLKGQAPSTLSYADITLAPPIGGWARAVIAFKDPSTIDFRAPTTAWHIAPDGRVDPEGYQSAMGLPPTLDAMLVYFGVPASGPASSSSSFSPSLIVSRTLTSSRIGDLAPLAAGLGALVLIGLAIGIGLRRRQLRKG